MIDSTADPPKEEFENLKPYAIAILALLLAACATGSFPTNPVGAESNQATEASATRVPSEPSQAAKDSDESGDGVDEAEPTHNGDSSAEPSPDSSDEGSSSESDEKPTSDEKKSKPRRVVLKTVYDDKRVGEEERDKIEAELGLVEDEELLEYVRSVGIRLVRHAPSRPFDYEFKIVDQRVPNAFALPGGKIYVSRGLLALVESEDELAGVIGHEITHAAERHAAARIDYSRRINPFSIGLMRAATIAAYGRDQERDADRGGQIMAARAGYNPAGIATFLRRLDAADRYEIGWSRLPHFLSTHPTSPERSSLAANRAAGLSWERKPGIADDLPDAYYSVIDGLILGDNPAGGLFEDSRFVHPDLRFAIRFPRGWSTFNSQEAVGAISESHDAEATLTVAGKGDDLEKIVDDFIRSNADGKRMKVLERRRVRLGDLPAIRIEGRAIAGGLGLSAQMTFVAHEGLVYRLSVLSLPSAANKYRGRARAFAHSFRGLDAEATRSLQVIRLRIAKALENETLEALSLRTHNDIDLVYTGVMNGLYAETMLTKGQSVKIGLAEPYLPKPKEEATAEAADSKNR